MTPEEKRQRLISLGYDPDEVSFEEDVQPSGPVTQGPTVKPTSSTLGAFGRSAARGVIPSLAAGAGAFGVGSLLDLTGVGAPIGIPLQLAGAGVAGFGARKLQDVVAPSVIPGYTESEQADVGEHPIASTLGSIASTVAGGLNPSISNIPRAARTVRDLTVGVKPAISEIQNLANVGIGTVIPPAQEAAISLATGQGLPSASDLALSAAGGALFSQPNVIGQKLFGWHPTTPAPRVNLDALRQSLRGEDLGVTAKPRDFTKETTSEEPGINSIFEEIKKYPEDIQLEMLHDLAAATGKNIEGRQVKTIPGFEQLDPVQQKAIQEAAEKALQKRINKADAIAQKKAEQIAKQVKIKPEEVEPQLGEFPGTKVEEKTPAETIPTEEPVPFNPLQTHEIVTKPPITEETPPISGLESQAVRELKTPEKRPVSEIPIIGSSTGEKVLYQPASEIGVEAQKKGYSIRGTEAWHNLFQRLGVQRGVKFDKGLLVNENTGKEIAGQAYLRQGINEAVAKINPNKAKVDTWPHELFHIFYHDLLASDRIADNRVANSGNRAVETSSEYQAAKAANPKLTPHEYLTTKVGEDTIRRILKTDNKSKFSNWLQDFWSHIKTKWGNATPSDYARLFSNKLLFDRPFREETIDTSKQAQGIHETLAQSKEQGESNIDKPKAHDILPVIGDELHWGNNKYKIIGWSDKKSEPDYNIGNQILQHFEPRHVGQHWVAKVRQIDSNTGELIGPESNTGFRSGMKIIKSSTKEEKFPKNYFTQEQDESELGRIASLSNEDFRKETKGGFTEKAYELGQSLKSQEDVDNARQIHQQVMQEFKNAVDNKDYESAIILGAKQQFISEAIGAATGKGSAGEFLKENKGTEYKPQFQQGESELGDISLEHRRSLITKQAKLSEDFNATKDRIEKAIAKAETEGNYSLARDLRKRFFGYLRDKGTNEISGLMQGESNLTPDQRDYKIRLLIRQQNKLADIRDSNLNKIKFDARLEKLASDHILKQGETPTEDKLNHVQDMMGYMIHNITRPYDIKNAELNELLGGTPVSEAAQQLYRDFVTEGNKKELDSLINGYRKIIHESPEGKKWNALQDKLEEQFELQREEIRKKYGGMLEQGESELTGDYGNVESLADIRREGVTKGRTRIKIPSIQTGSPEAALPIMRFTPTDTHLPFYKKWLMEQKGLSEKDANEIVQKFIDARLAQPESELGKTEEQPKEKTPEELLRGNVAPPKEGEEVVGMTKVKIPQFNGPRTSEPMIAFDDRLPSRMLEYEKWLQKVKGLSEDKAKEVIAKLSFGLKLEQDYSAITPLNQEDANNIRYAAASNIIPNTIPEQHFEREWHLGKFRPEIDKVAALGETGKTVADSMQHFYEGFTRGIGKYVNGIVRPLKDSLGIGFFKSGGDVKSYISQNNEAANHVRDYLWDMADNGKSNIVLTPQEQDAAEVIRQYLINVRDEQNSREGLRKGGYGPDYFPFVVDREVTDNIVNFPNKPESQKLIKDFIDYQKSQGRTEKEALNQLQEFRAGYSKEQPNLAKQFGPIDKAAGIGIPRSWREKNLIDTMARYGNRVARRFAYYDAMESNPKFEAALTDPKSGVAGNDAVKTIMRDIAGIRPTAELFRTAALGLLKSSIFGPLTGARNFAQNFTIGLEHSGSPALAIRSFVDSVNSLRDNLADSFKQGVNRENIGSLEFGDEGNTNLISILRRMRDISSDVQGRNILERITRAITYGQGKFLAMHYLAEANKTGSLSKEAQQFFKNFGKGIDVSPTKQQFTPQELNSIAARLVENIQGTYDYRGLPQIAVEGTLAPFLALSRWSLERSNNFMKYVVNPALNGNYKPFLLSTLGMVLGGTAVNAITKLATGKEEKTATFKELSEGAKSGANVIPDIFYKMAALSSVSGYAGILGDVAKAAGDAFYAKQKPQSYNNALVEGISNAGETFADLVEAVREGGVTPESLVEFVNKLLTDNVQTYRVALAQFGPETKDNIDRINKLRDLRVFNTIYGNPITDLSDAAQGNVLKDRDVKQFKKTQDIGEAIKMLPDLIQGAFDKAKGNVDRLKQELQSIKTNQYPTMPNPESIPLTFLNYLTFLKRTQGEEVASQRLMDYLTRNEVNREKSELIPSL